MSYSLDLVQDAIVEYLDVEIVQDKYETGVPDATQLVRSSSGSVLTYITYQFGDLQQAPTRSAAGTQNDDYYMPVYVQCISDTANNARRLSNRVTQKLLGFQTRFASQVYKRPGGGMFPVQSSIGATEAFIQPSSFAITVQLATV